MSISSFAHLYRAMMGSTVTLEPYTGAAGGGSLVPTFGPAKTYQCYVNEDPIQTINREGQEVVSSARIFVYPVASDATPLLSLDDRSRVTLADGTQPIVHNITTQLDQRGNVQMYVIIV